MAAEILKGIEAANAQKAPLSERAARLAASCGRKPSLALVRVGARPDDIAYERAAVKRCAGLGIDCVPRLFDAMIPNAEFLDAFSKLNADGAVDGILVFSPLPAHIDTAAVRTLIDPAKDVDCMSPVNMAKLFEGDTSGHAPCTPAAVMEIIRHFGIPVAGSCVTLVGRSLVVGKPLAMLLLAAHATVTVCHTRTADLAAECRRADILIAAAGKARMIGAAHVKPGATVIDVGINVGADGGLCGDVDFEAVRDVAGRITPVPGGVGSVTTTILARNTLDAHALTCGLTRS